MQDELQTFLESPTAGNYRRVREALADECGAANAADLVRLAALATTGKANAALDQADNMQPAWALSPRVHYYAALAAMQANDDEAAELERFLFQTCLEGILATGEGTVDSPYVITYLSDEQDVLTALGLESRSQSLVDRDGLLCDVLKCVDGEEIWFEISQLLHDPRQARAELAGPRARRAFRAAF